MKKEKNVSVIEIRKKINNYFKEGEDIEGFEIVSYKQEGNTLIVNVKYQKLCGTVAWPKRAEVVMDAVTKEVKNFKEQDS